MSRHIEWAGANYIQPEVIDPGDEFSDSYGQELDSDSIALVLSYGDALVIEAKNIGELRALRDRITRAIGTYATPRHPNKKENS